MSIILAPRRNDDRVAGEDHFCQITRPSAYTFQIRCGSRHETPKLSSSLPVVGVLAWVPCGGTPAKCAGYLAGATRSFTLPSATAPPEPRAAVSKSEDREALHGRPFRRTRSPRTRPGAKLDSLMADQPPVQSGTLQLQLEAPCVLAQRLRGVEQSTDAAHGAVVLRGRPRCGDRVVDSEVGARVHVCQAPLDDDPARDGDGLRRGAGRAVTRARRRAVEARMSRATARAARACSDRVATLEQERVRAHPAHVTRVRSRCRPGDAGAALPAVGITVTSHRGISRCGPLRALSVIVGSRRDRRRSRPSV